MKNTMTSPKTFEDKFYHLMSARNITDTRTILNEIELSNELISQKRVTFPFEHSSDDKRLIIAREKAHLYEYIKELKSYLSGLSNIFPSRPWVLTAYLDHKGKTKTKVIKKLKKVFKKRGK